MDVRNATVAHMSTCTQASSSDINFGFQRILYVTFFLQCTLRLQHHDTRVSTCAYKRLHIISVIVCT
jgi:hypothetical protein